MNSLRTINHDLCKDRSTRHDNSNPYSISTEEFASNFTKVDFESKI